MTNKYLWMERGEKTWEDIARRVVTTVVGPYLPEMVEPLIKAITERKFMPGGRYLYASGKPLHQVQNCALFSVEDNKESIGDLFRRVGTTLMTGAGVGIVWSALRPNGAPVAGMGGTSTGPCAFMKAVNEIGRNIMQGGSRRAAIWAGLHWNHPDVFEFMALKDWDEITRQGKEADYNFPAPMDMTNISVILDDDFFEAYYDEEHPDHGLAHAVYWTAVEKMLQGGEPGFSVDIGENAGEHLRNACTEITSSDDNDICNLGSINLARVDSIAEFGRLVELGTAFLLCGTLYSDLPIAEIGEVREKNRRLGLGLMGVHEWLLKRGYEYAPNEELGMWLEKYAKSTEIAAALANYLGITPPVKTRAIAPNGTIAILAETVSSAEPIFAVAIKRRYLKGTSWHYQYVIDPAVERLLEYGIDPDSIETAYELAKDPDRRLAFQAWLQQYVDHGISSTINLPAPDAQPFTADEFGEILMKHLPNLRGVTVYPDGARTGQPITTVPYAEARDWVGFEYEEVGNSQACNSGVCGI